MIFDSDETLKDQLAKEDLADDMAKMAKKNLPKPRIALALSSGVAKGFAHIGVIRALLKYGIEPTIISGTSIGAVVGGAYLAGKLDVLENWGKSLNRFRMMSYLDFRVRSGGLIGGKKIMSLMQKNFGDIKIEDLPHPFTAIATDMTTGHEVWLKKGRVVDAVTASFSLPGIFPPVFNDNRWLLDGALVNPIPVSACRAAGAQMVIAVNLGGDFIGKAKKPGASFPTVAGFDILSEENENKASRDHAGTSWVTKKFFNREDKEAPSLFGVMMAAMNISQDRLSRSRLAGDPPDVMISPRIGHIGLMEFDRADECIKAGEEAVERALPYIRDAYQVLVADRYASHEAADQE